uniref:NB-ARC domain-containing protein n=1 Tax=Fagus sylvatica TaxID=28930 RepID=A0A2N9HRC1_FAGSY
MCCKGWCPDWIWRYKLGKEATKKTTNAAKLFQEAAGWDLNQLTHRAPLPDIVTFSSNDDYEVFQSRKFIFEELMEALRDDNCKRIGLHGLGGVGKTTLVMDVCKKAKDLFSDIVKTTVSQTPDIDKNPRIKQAEKKILIILDDVWKDVKLGDIGIPSGEDQEKCKILLTTRSEHVCDLMHCSKKILLKFLSNEESLALIKKTASIVDDSPALNDVVLQVVEECKGLPIAIVTVGKALIRKSLTDWEVALRELKNSRYVEICGVDEDNNAYVCLKWSYDHLNRKTKLCFLMCSLFPEDYDISIEELSRYAMGLEEYNQDVNSLDEVRKPSACGN